jgi:hypothetical protein
MELVKVDNGNAILAEDAIKTIVEIETMMKSLKAKQDEIKVALLEAMETNNVIKLDTPELLISYVASSDRETFDSKRFKDEHQDLYDEYVTMTPVKSSIRIKVK